MKKIFFLLAIFLLLTSCNQDLKNWIKNFEEWKFSESTKIFEKISQNWNEKDLFNLGNSLYKEKKFLEAEKNFKKIYENKKISQKTTSLKNSWKIEYQIWNLKYKIWDKLGNPKKLSTERKMQKVFWKNFDKIIENYQESIANYKLWIEKNNLNLKKDSENLEFKNLDKFLTENLNFVEKKLEEIKKEKQKKQEEEDKKNWKQSQKPNSWNQNSDKNWDKKNQEPKLNQDQLQKLQNQLDRLNQEEIQLKWGFDRFWKNNFKLKAEPWEMEMQTLEEFLNSEENKNEEIFDSGEKDW